MIDTVAKSDIFFFVTTICVIVATVALVIALAYGIRIITDVKYIVRKAKDETDEIVKDLQDVRKATREKARSLGALVSAFGVFAGKGRHKKKDSEN